MLVRRSQEVLAENKKSVDLIPQLQTKLENFQVKPRDIPAAIAELSSLHEKMLAMDAADTDTSKKTATDTKFLNKLINYGHLDAEDIASLDSCSENVKNDINHYKKFTDEKNAYIVRVKEFLTSLAADVNHTEFKQNTSKLVTIPTSYRVFKIYPEKTNKGWTFCGMEDEVYNKPTIEKDWHVSDPSPIAKLKKILAGVQDKQAAVQPDKFYLDTFVHIVDIMNHAFESSKKPVHQTTANFYDQVLSDINALSFYPHVHQQQMRLSK